MKNNSDRNRPTQDTFLRRNAEDINRKRGEIAREARPRKRGLGAGKKKKKGGKF